MLWRASFLVLGRLAAFALTGSHGLEWDTHQLVLQSAAVRLCLATDALGPSIPTDPVNQAQYYFHCVRYYVWEPRMPLGRLLAAGLQPPATPFALAYLLALLGWWRVVRSGTVSVAGTSPVP